MLKNWQTIALVVTLFAVTFFASSFLFPASYQICQPSEYTHAKDCGQHHLGPYVFLWIGLVADAHNGLISAIAAIFIAGFTWTLYEATTNQAAITDKALKLARDEFNASHTPKIEMYRIYRETFEIGQYPKIRFLIANEGETAAKIICAKFAIEIDHHLPAIRVPERWDDGELTDMEIPVHGAVPWLVTWRKTLTAAEYDALIANHRQIFLLADIEYEDVSGTRRGKALCFKYERPTDRFRLQSDPNYTYGS